MDQEEDVIDSAFKLGIRHFQSENYVKLLKVFSRAIDLAQSYDEKDLHGVAKRPLLDNKLIHPRLSGLLDSRALTYEKLKKFRQAGKDGEDLIEIDPYNSKGYLRVAKILISLDSKIDAYKILSKGQKKIQDAIDNKGLKRTLLFDQLIRQKKGLATTLRLPKRALDSTTTTTVNVLKRPKMRVLDPLVLLPVELFKIVLSNIPFREAANMLLVCKNWNIMVSNIPEFWSEVELRKPVSSTAFKNLYNKIIVANNGRFHKRINNLKLLPRRSDEKPIMNVIFNLTKLQIINLQIVLQELDLKNLLTTLVSSKLARHNFANLQELKIETSVVSKFENYLFEVMPKLQKLELIISEIKSSRNVVEQELNNELLSKLASNYKVKQYDNLTKLSIISKTDTASSKLPFEELVLSKKFPNLQTLLIVGFKIPNMSIFRQLNLKEIVLEQNPELRLDSFLSINTQNLKTLYFREFKVNTEFQIPYGPLLHLQNLKILDLTGSCINYDGLIKLLLLTNENLEILNIGACSNLVWQSSAFDRSRRLANFQEIIHLCPNLLKLSLNQSTNLNDFTLKSMGQIILSTYQFYKLECLDLSFNNITGHGLVEFFQLHKPNKIKVVKLIVDGNDIKHETLKFLMNRGYVDSLQYEFAKRSWKQYGVNSFSPNY